MSSATHDRGGRRGGAGEATRHDRASRWWRPSPWRAVASDGRLAFMPPPPGQPPGGLDYRIRLLPSGDLRFRMVAHFLDEEGGTLPVPKPLTGGVEDLVVDGRPPGHLELRDGERARHRRGGARHLHGDRWGEGRGRHHGHRHTAGRRPRDASRQDPDVDVTGVLRCPRAPPPTTSSSTGSTVCQEVDVRPAKVRFEGGPPLDVVRPPARRPAGRAGPGLAGPSPRSPPRRRSGGRCRSRTPTATRSSRPSTARRSRSASSRVDPGGVGAGVCLLMVVQWYRLQTSDRRARERYQASFPFEHLADPPDTRPAVVACSWPTPAGSTRARWPAPCSTSPIAGSLAIDGYRPDRWCCAPLGGEGHGGPRASGGRALKAQAPGGEITGPPVGGQGPGWWRAYRAAVFRQARTRGLVRRRFLVLYMRGRSAGIVAPRGRSGPPEHDLAGAGPVDRAGPRVCAALGGGFEPTLAGGSRPGGGRPSAAATADQGHWRTSAPPASPCGARTWPTGPCSAPARSPPTSSPPWRPASGRAGEARTRSTLRSSPASGVLRGRAQAPAERSTRSRNSPGRSGRRRSSRGGCHCTARKVAALEPRWPPDAVGALESPRPGCPGRGWRWPGGAARTLGLAVAERVAAGCPARPRRCGSVERELVVGLVAVEVLVEGAAEGHVGDLQAPAHAEVGISVDRHAHQPAVPRRRAGVGVLARAVAGPP